MMHSNSNDSHSLQNWEALKKQLDEMSKPPTSPEEELLWYQARAKWSEEMYAVAVELEKHRLFDKAIRAYYLSLRTTGLYAAERRLGFEAVFQDPLHQQSVYASKIEIEIEIKIDASAEDCFYAGLRYFVGLGVKQNAEEAFNSFNRAAEKGYAEAQNSLGWMYSYGCGVTKNDKEAVKWFRTAEKNGDVNALSNLGWMYSYGRGVPLNVGKAIQWYSKAAAQGYVYAQYSLGRMYVHGCGVTRNDKEAVKWFRKAAAQGYIYAQYSLGLMYVYGRGVTQNDEEAVQWFCKAAKQGHYYFQSTSRPEEQEADLSKLPKFLRLKESLDTLSYQSRNQDRMKSLTNLRSFAKQIERDTNKTWEEKHEKLYAAIKERQVEVEKDHQNNGFFAKLKKSSCCIGSVAAFFKIETQSRLARKLGELTGNKELLPGSTLSAL